MDARTSHSLSTLPVTKATQSGASVTEAKVIGPEKRSNTPESVLAVAPGTKRQAHLVQFHSCFSFCLLLGY